MRTRLDGLFDAIAAQFKLKIRLRQVRQMVRRDSGFRCQRRQTIVDGKQLSFELGSGVINLRRWQGSCEGVQLSRRRRVNAVAGQKDHVLIDNRAFTQATRIQPWQDCRSACEIQQVEYKVM